MATSRPSRTSNGSTTAIILVHRRPANVELQVRAALHSAAVGEVVVSCNNPEVKLRDWLTVSSPRLRVIEEEGRNQTRRYDLARQADGDRFVLPDDDVLYLPESLEGFCNALPSHGRYPIGLAGQRCSESGVWESAITGTGEEVDVLNRAYVCTRQHVEGVFRSAEILGWDETALYSSPADDVLLSYGGDELPQVVDMEHVNCVSHAHRGISTYRQADFDESRAEWVSQLRKGLERRPARADLGRAGALRAAPNGVARLINTAAAPLRRRYYFGENIFWLRSLPAPVRRVAGLDDSAAVWSRRFQVGMRPAPLAGFVRIGDASPEPDVVASFPIWNTEFKRSYAAELIAIGALDDVGPEVVPRALASWRSMMTTGARLVVGVRDSAAVLAERDARVGVRSWASQLASAEAPLTSPLQLESHRLTTTLWDEQRLRDAIDAQGFETLAVVRREESVASHPSVASGWSVDIGGKPLDVMPIPALIEGSADLIAIAVAR